MTTQRNENKIPVKPRITVYLNLVVIWLAGRLQSAT